MQFLFILFASIAECKAFLKTPLPVMRGNLFLNLKDSSGLVFFI
jgi:hypothetical protein